MESEKSTSVEDKGLAKGKPPLEDDGGGGGDKPESGKRPKIEETKPPQSSKLFMEEPYYQEYADHQNSMTSDNTLAIATRQLVSKDSDGLVEPLLNSIIYRMRLKWFDIGDLIIMKRTIDENIPLDSRLRSSVVPPIPPELRKIDMNLFREGVSDEELCQELQFAVEQKAAVLGESCVKSVAELLGRYEDICKRLKELEATTKSQKEKLESKEFVSARSANMNLIPGLPNVKLTPGSVNLRLIPGTRYLELTPVLPDRKSCS